MLGGSLPSLLRQDYPHFQAFLVDDGSSDGTGEVAQTIAEEAEKPLNVVVAGEKPAGWAGKVFALSRGLEAVMASPEPPDWLLLTDADIRHPVDSVASLVAKAQRGGYDLVSVMARLHAVTFYERLLIPPFVYFFHLLYPFREVGRRGSPVAAAAGGCILLRVSTLLERGGFDSIREALIDDVALGRLVKEGKGQLWLGFDPEIESIRPYRGLAELWQMVARSAFVQLQFSHLAVIGVVVGLALFFCSPPALIAAGLLSAAWGSFAIGFAVVGLAGAAWGLQALMLRPYVRHHRCPWFYAWLLPVASVLYACMTVSSAWDHLRRRGSSWKGRGYGP